MSFEEIACTTKQERDELFQKLRKTGNRLERQAIRYSEPVMILDPKVEGEILLDSKGRPRYTQIWVVAYPRV